MQTVRPRHGPREVRSDSDGLERAATAAAAEVAAAAAAGGDDHEEKAGGEGGGNYGARAGRG